MSFINPITGNIPNNEFIFTETNISADNASFTNISAVNASFVNLTTTIFTPVNVNSSQISVSVLNVSTGNMSVLNISTVNVSDLIVDELELINLSVDNISNDIIDTEVINIKSNNSLLPNGQLRKLNNEVILSLGDAGDVGSFSIKPDGTNTELNLTNNVLTGDTANFDTVNADTVNADNSVTDALYLNEQSVVLTDKSVIRRDANQVLFIGKSDAGDVTGADFLFRTGEETGGVKLRIPRTSDIVEMIALAVDTSIQATTGVFSAVNVSDLNVADTTTLSELEVLTEASIRNLNVIGPNGLTAAKGTITNLSSTNVSIGNLTAQTINGNIFTNLSAGTNIGLSQSSGVTTISTLAQVEFDDLTLETLTMLDSVNSDPTLLSRTNNTINFIGTTNNTPLTMNFFMKNFINTPPLLILDGPTVTAEVNGNVSVSGTIKGDISQNLLAGTGINLSTNPGTGITTITNTGIITDPLNLSTLNASNVNASTITGNIGGNLLGGVGINISTSVNTGITTITNTGIITDPLNVSTLNGSVVNASTLNVSVLNPEYIEGFTKSTQYVFRAIGTSTNQTLSAGTKIAFNTPVVETPSPVIVSGFVDKGFDPVLQQYKIHTPGLYGFGCITYYNNAAFTIKIGIFKNGVVVTSAGNNSSTSDSITTIINCDDGDWIEVKCVSGGGDTVPANNTFWGYRLEPANNFITSTTNLSIQNLSVADDMSVTNMSVTNLSTSYLTGINAVLNTININASAKIAVVNTSQLNVSNMSGNLVTINSLNAYYSESEFVYYTNNAFGAPGTANAQPGVIFKNLEELQIRSGSVAFPGNIHFTRDGTTTNMIYDGDLNISSKANISNISATNATISNALTGAGNINITGDVSAGIISGATLTGNIAGNLAEGYGIELATSLGVTSITTLPAYFYASLASTYTPGNLTQYTLKYDSVPYVPVGFSYNSGTGFLTVTNAGTYEISASANMDVVSFTDRVTLRARLRINTIWVQGDPQSYSYMRHQTYGMYGTSTISPTIKILAAGDQIDISCNVNKGNSTVFGSDFSGLQFFNGCNILVKRLH